MASGTRRSGDLVFVIRVSRRAVIAGAAMIAVALVLATPALVRALPPVSYPVTLPHSFSNGAIADASEVNENFVTLRDAVNDLEGQISAITSRTPPTYSSSSDFAIFETPGTSQFTVPQGVTRILVEAWGSGSGGSNQHGAGGGYGKDFFAVTPGQAITVVVGNGGAPNLSGGVTQIQLAGVTVLSVSGGSAGTPGSSAARINVTGSANQNSVPGFVAGGTPSQAPGSGGIAGTSGFAGRIVIWY